MPRRTRHYRVDAVAGVDLAGDHHLDAAAMQPARALPAPSHALISDHPGSLANVDRPVLALAPALLVLLAARRLGRVDRRCRLPRDQRGPLPVANCPPIGIVPIILADAILEIRIVDPAHLLIGDQTKDRPPSYALALRRLSAWAMEMGIAACRRDRRTCRRCSMCRCQRSREA